MDNENAHNTLVGKDKSEIQFGIPRSRWKGDINLLAPELFF